MPVSCILLSKTPDWSPSSRPLHPEDPSGALDHRCQWSLKPALLTSTFISVVEIGVCRFGTRSADWMIARTVTSLQSVSAWIICSKLGRKGSGNVPWLNSVISASRCTAGSSHATSVHPNAITRNDIVDNSRMHIDGRIPILDKHVP